MTENIKEREVVVILNKLTEELDKVVLDIKALDTLDDDSKLSKIFDNLDRFRKILIRGCDEIKKKKR